MEKKQTYLDFNAELEVTGMDVKGITLQVYDEKGDSVPFLIPTKEETQEAMYKMLSMFENTEMRTIVFLAERFQEFAQQTCLGALQTAHALAHDPNFNKDLDEDKLCDGVMSYLHNVKEKGTITPENTHEVLLKNFFHVGHKPN